MAAIALTGQPIKVQAQFWKHVPNGLPDGDCWPWAGKTNRAGYGRICLSGQPWIASRIMLELKLRRGLNEGELACHHCDNPGCVNPAHLFVGTAFDNQRDKWEKGRAGQKLTPDDARRIWELRDATPGAAGFVAKRFGVQRIAVWRIWRGITWSNVTGAQRPKKRAACS